MSKSIKERIRDLVTLELLNKDSIALQNCFNDEYLSLNPELNTNKLKKKKFQQLLFASPYFNNKRLEVISKAILQYNKKNFQLVKSDDLFILNIKTEDLKYIQKIDKDLRKMFDYRNETEEKIVQIVKILIEHQNRTQNLIKRKFKDIGGQHSQLSSQNQQLNRQLESMQNQIGLISKQLQEKSEQEYLMKKKQIERKNQKRQAMTKKIYEFLIYESEVVLSKNIFRGARLRLALALLLFTGIKIAELLPLKIHQIKTLFVNHWITIDRDKQGSSNNRAFLSKEGINIIRKHLDDFKIVSNYKNENSYIFTVEGSNKPLDHQAFNRIINKFIKECAIKIDSKPTLKNHSFQIGFITELWQDTNDIKFVLQALEKDSKINITSEYVENF